MKAFSVVVPLFLIALTSPASGDTFGSGANTFNIDFVTIGNPGNAADTSGSPSPAGSVAYTYNIGKFDVSRGMITKANTVASLGITLADMSSFGGNVVNHPATGVSWNEAARFINWLNTSTGSPPAYKFALQPGDAGYNSVADIQLWTPSDAGYNPINPYRNSLARYFLPSVDEWYKAAYYDPTSSVYYNYATGSNSAPTPVASGTAAESAVYDQATNTGPADITLAGGLSRYGTMGQGGNVYQWQETDDDLVNDSSSSARAARGGCWNRPAAALTSSNRINGLPSDKFGTIGFRVASIPEPSTLLLATAAFTTLLTVRRKSVPTIASSERRW
jgi:hypothetical protein